MKLEPIHYEIKRLFHGFASPRDYVVEQAKREGRDLILVHKEEIMRIPHERLGEGRVDQHEHISKHTGEPYHLIDFEWRPTTKQTTLL